MRVVLVTFFCAVILLSTSTAVADIISVSIPVGSQNGLSVPLADNVWSVSAPPYPLDVTTGIGNLINPTLPPAQGGGVVSFVLHTNGTYGGNVPDPTRQIVTYVFDRPTIVNQVRISEHYFGVSQIEGFYGDDLGSMVSLGATVGSLGAGPYTPELALNVFDLGNSTGSGTIFQWVVTRTVHPSAYAAYRAYLYDANGDAILAATDELVPIPEPSSWALIGLGVVAILLLRRRGETA